MLYVDGESKLAHVEGAKLASVALIPCHLLGDEIRLRQASLDKAGGDAWTETSSPRAHRGVGKYQTVDALA
jgi:hypothetical protein